MEKAIVIDGLKKYYGEKAAVDGISFEVEQGTLFSLLGVNGAGKTTTIKMLTGLVKPDCGDAYVMGRSVKDELDQVKKIVSVSPQDTAIAPNLTVRENLEFIAGIYGMGRKKARQKADEMIEEFSFADVEKTMAKTLSGGWQRRLSIAMALITEPEVLFLDEPTLGLDVIARRELEAGRLSDKAAVMVKGKIKAVGSVEELLKNTGKATLEDAFVSIVGSE